jgi:hypothetical protein
LAASGKITPRLPAANPLRSTMSFDNPVAETGRGGPLHPGRVLLHPLVYLREGEDITVGRPDTDVYCVLPPDGAALLRKLGDGSDPEEAALWYAETYGETVDIDEFLGAMDELGYVRHEDVVMTDQPPLRWQRLGRALFSRWAFCLYTALVGASVVVMFSAPALAPHYRNIFFSRYLTVIELTMFLGQLPLLLLHEAFHALAGRTVGLRSSLGVGRRLHFIVFETTMDGLVAIPRRQRLLPMLAGMVADALVIALFTLIAAAMRRPDGSLPLVAGALLGLAFGTVLRLVWQFYFYLQTDLYYVVVTVLGCVDLHKTAKQMLANRMHRILRRPQRCVDESTWHPRDRAVARWYSWLLLVGYSISIGVVLWAAIPATVLVFVRLSEQFGSHTGSPGFLDAVILLALNVGQAVIVAAIIIRDRRRHRTYGHVIA